jgi:hypothetical protein
VAPQNPGEPNLAKDPVGKEAIYGKDSTDSRNLKRERLLKRRHDVLKSNLAGQDVEASYREKKRSRTSKPRHVNGLDTYKGGPHVLNNEVPCKKYVRAPKHPEPTLVKSKIGTSTGSDQRRVKNADSKQGHDAVQHGGCCANYNTRKCTNCLQYSVMQVRGRSHEELCCEN